MFSYSLGYRHVATDEVEGFIGYGFSIQSAKRDAIRQASEKAGYTGGWKADNLITAIRDCNKAEMKTIMADWRDIRDGKRKRGSSII